MEPSIGSFVQYGMLDHESGAYRACPAVITEVSDPVCGEVGLCVFSPTGVVCPRGVQYAADLTAHCWSQPPAEAVAVPLQGRSWQETTVTEFIDLVRNWKTGDQQSTGRCTETPAAENINVNVGDIATAAKAFGHGLLKLLDR